MSRFRSLFRDLSDAIRGTEQDYTEGPIARAILLLAVPMVLEMFMESLFAVADVFFVSRLGADAVAAVGPGVAPGHRLHGGDGALDRRAATVARRIGEHDFERASTTAVQGIAVGLMAALLFGLGGFVFAPGCSS